MSLQLPFGIQPTNAVPVDFFYGPYADVPTAISSVPEAVRYEGQTVYILGDGEYRWVGGTGDGDLVASGGGSVIAVQGLMDYSGDIGLGGPYDTDISISTDQDVLFEIKNEYLQPAPPFPPGQVDSTITKRIFLDRTSIDISSSNSENMTTSGTLAHNDYMFMYRTVGVGTMYMAMFDFGITIIDGVNQKWMTYGGDYSLLSLSNPRAIPDVAGVELIAANSNIYGGDGTLTGNRYLYGDIGNYLLAFRGLNSFDIETLDVSGGVSAHDTDIISNNTGISIRAKGVGANNQNRKGQVNLTSEGGSLASYLTGQTKQYEIAVDHTNGAIVYDLKDFKGLQRANGQGVNLSWGVDNDYYVTMGDVITNVGGGDTIFTGGTFSGPSALLGAGQNLEIGTAASRLSRVDIRTDGASTVISDLTGGVFESQITVQGFGTTLNSSNLGINQISTLFSSGALGESTMRVQNAALQQTKISTLISEGIVFTNDIGNTWAKYDQDYSLLGLLDDLSIPDVGGVKTLIGSTATGAVQGLSNYGSDVGLGGTYDVPITIESTSNTPFTLRNTYAVPPNPANGFNPENRINDFVITRDNAYLFFYNDYTLESSGFSAVQDEIFFYRGENLNLQALRISSALGVYIQDDVNQKGIQRAVGSGANLSWGVDTNYYVTMGDVIANVGGGVSITDNYIPIGNATNDGVEDSRLQILSSGAGPTGTMTEIIKGTTGAQLDNTLTFDVRDNVYTGGDSARIAHSVSLQGGLGGTLINVSTDVNFASLTADYARTSVPGGATKKVDLFNFWGSETGLGVSTYFTAYGGVRYMGHKHGSSDDPRSGVLGASDAYTWMSNDAQSVLIGHGTESVVNALNAHLGINSFDASTNPMPHLRFLNDYDTSNGAVSNNSMYLDSVDSKLHFIGSAGQNIILEDLIDTPSDELVTYKFTKGGAITTANVVSPGEFNTPMGVSVPFDVEVVDVSVQVGLATVSISGNMPIDIRTLASTSAGVGFPLTSGVGSSLHSFNCNHVAGTTYHRVYTSNGISSSTVTQGNILFVAIGTTTYTATTMDDIVVTVTCKKV